VRADSLAGFYTDIDGGVPDREYRVEVEHALCSRNHYHIEIQTI